MGAQTDLVEVLGQFDLKLVKMCPAGAAPKTETVEADRRLVEESFPSWNLGTRSKISAGIGANLSLELPETKYPLPMKLASNIAGGLLGLLFVTFGMLFFLKLGPKPPPPPEGSAVAMFMGAFAPTGYMAFVKALEVIGGILVAIPLTRNFGLLIIGPIIVNILAFQIFVAKGAGLFDPPVILVSVLAAFLLWSGRKAFAGLRG